MLNAKSTNGHSQLTPYWSYYFCMSHLYWPKVKNKTFMDWAEGVEVQVRVAVGYFFYWVVLTGDYIY